MLKSFDEKKLIELLITAPCFVDGDVDITAKWSEELTP